MSTSPIDQITPSPDEHGSTPPSPSAHRDAVPLFIDITSVPRGVCVMVSGEIDCETASQFRRALADAVDDNAVVDVDLGQVSFMDSSGLCALLEARNGAVDRAAMTIVAASPRVTRLLDITGLAGEIGPTRAAPSSTDPNTELLRGLVLDVTGCTAASIVRVRRGVPSTVAASDHLARAADAAQIDCDAGPTLAALRRSEVVVVPRIVRGPGRYEEFRSAATSLGIATAVALPVRVDETTLVAVTLYADTAGAIDVHADHEVIEDRVRAMGWTVADDLAPSAI